MTRRRWFLLIPAFLAVVGLSWGTVGAADKSRVDRATKQVEQGAKQIGQGQVGPGFKEMFTGVGHTIVEGAKFSGENIKEFFAGKK
jgi:ABC-type microcin C transport system permease subunit YejB